MIFGIILKVENCLPRVKLRSCYWFIQIRDYGTKKIQDIQQKGNSNKADI